jgi:hypothetical protein
VVHDAAGGGMQSRWTHALLGGGGGRVDPVLSFAVAPRVAWWASRFADAEDSLLTELGADGRLRVGVSRRALSHDRLIHVQRAEAGPDDPAWDLDSVAVHAGGLSGAFRARRALARVGFVGRTGTAWVGSVRPAERIDLSTLRWSRDLVSPHPAEDRIERLAREVGLRGGRVSHSVMALEAAPCAVAATAGGDTGPPCTIHVQPLYSDDPEEEPAGWLPADRRDARLRVHVPGVLWDRMLGEGRVLRPSVNYLSPDPPNVSPGGEDGFREVVFGVGGAVEPGLAGRPVEVLGRWPARAALSRSVP